MALGIFQKCFNLELQPQWNIENCGGHVKERQKVRKSSERPQEQYRGRVPRKRGRLWAPSDTAFPAGQLIAATAANLVDFKPKFFWGSFCQGNSPPDPHFLQAQVWVGQLPNTA